MEKPRIGVYICWCGTNIAKMVDVEAVAEEMAKLPNVVIPKIINICVLTQDRI